VNETIVRAERRSGAHKFFGYSKMSAGDWGLIAGQERRDGTLCIRFIVATFKPGRPERSMMCCTRPEVIYCLTNSWT
jgi:hypothetical protein